jgi:tetratricopeptide (TPR) repeat protein
MRNNSLTAKLLTVISDFVRHKFSQAYYHSKESLGQHKRDLVVLHVEQACASLEHSRNQFEETLDKFKRVVAMNDTPLEQKYKLLKRQYEGCQFRADEVGNRISAITQVSEALFAEWEAELKLYQNRTLRNHSHQQLKTARQHYARLIKSLSKAESKIQPVLAAFRDQVLFLKHNLNAQAIAALQHECTLIAVDISQLIAVMEKTIQEANQFVGALGEQKLLNQPPS